ncbi:MAG TPA: glycosyl hydrolase, partial [Gemmatimonadaceae bacterium]|nr:glycosyl hydrolase [Gemmatimonadaceae bacterium]
VYALVENDNGGLFRSDDAGATWTLVNANRAIRQRAFYYTHVYADPANQDVVYMQNTSLFRSTDGGKTTTTLGGTHGDHHALWIDPDDVSHLIDGNDGGGAISTNTGLTWTSEDYPTEQFYHVATTAHAPYHACGSQQDNTTLCTPSDWNLIEFLGDAAGRGGRGFGGGSARKPPGAVDEPASGGMQVSYEAAGGEPGYIAPDPKNLDVFYSGTNNGGFMDRYDRRTGHTKEVNPYPWHYSGEPALEIPERWQWTYPIVFSPVDPNVLYAGSQRLWKTTTRGESWTAISGDLTRHDPKTMGHSGGPITGDMNGPEVYAVIFSIGPSKRDVNVIWTGSDDGLIHVTRDGGKTWSNVTPKEMPDFGRVSQIDASAFDVGTAYVSVRRPLMDDKAPYIFRTHDFGKTWTRIVNGIGAQDWVHAVREDPVRRGMLYAATQHGVFVSFDDGAHWQSLSLNLPEIPVSDLLERGNDLVISTHGRGFYVLDDVAPVREYDRWRAAQTPWLFQPSTGTRSTAGVLLTYALPAAARRVTLTILDSAGHLVRTFVPDSARRDSMRTDSTRRDTTRATRDSTRAEQSGGGFGQRAGPFTSAAAGVHRLLWDLRYESATTFPGMILWGATTMGPAVPPGRYTVRLDVDGRAQSKTMRVVRNPMFTDVSDADLRAQAALALRVRDKVSEANNAVVQIRGIKTAAADRMKQKDDAQLKAAGARLTTNLGDVEDDIYQVKNQSGQDPLNFPIRINNRLANLLRVVTSADGRPIANAPVLLSQYSRLLGVQTARLQHVLDTDLAAFNAELARVGLPRINAACPSGTNCGLVP